MTSDASTSTLPSALLVVIASEPDLGRDCITNIKSRVIRSKGSPKPEDSQMTAITAIQQGVHGVLRSGSKKTLSWEELNETVGKLRRENKADPRSVAVISEVPLAHKFASLRERISCDTRRKNKISNLSESDYKATWEDLERMGGK